MARPPAAPLAKFAEYLWASQGAPAHAKERVVPTGTLELFFSLVDDGRFSGATVAPIQITPNSIARSTARVRSRTPSLLKMLDA